MKGLILLALLIPLSLKSNGPSKFDFIELTVRAPFRSIVLIDEGLICSRYDEISKRDEVKFFSFYEIDYKKFDKLENYISTHKLFNMTKAQPEQIDSIYVVNHDIITKSFYPPTDIYPLRIGYIQDNENIYSSFIYRYCDQKVDTMITLLDNIIPKAYKAKYSILPLCR